ncbi:MAG: DUF4249 domain-containing protein [Bacteroidetes bacterium]|nr:MAG: DUF4249 domain-containing protein [Bacteroidota bacterium]
MLTGLHQCVEPFVQNNEWEGGQIIIYGRITTLDEPQYVDVSVTASTARVPIQISTARVELVDQDGQREDYQLESPGKYRLDRQKITVVPGRAYHVEVQLENGDRYASEPEIMPLLTARDTSYFEPRVPPGTLDDKILVSNQRLTVLADTRIPQGSPPQLLRWHVQEVYVFPPTDFPDPFNTIPPPCYATEYPNAQLVNLFDGEVYKVNQIDRQVVARRPIDQSFRGRHYFTVYSSALTRRAFTYWQQVSLIANQSGSIFDTPPAAIKGNVYRVGDPEEKVLGYVEANDVNFSRFFVVPGWLPYLIIDECQYIPGKDYFTYPKACLDCVSPPGRVREKPPYFE